MRKNRRKFKAATVPSSRALSPSQRQLVKDDYSRFVKEFDARTKDIFVTSYGKSV